MIILDPLIVNSVRFSSLFSLPQGIGVSMNIPSFFQCAITHDVMSDPVIDSLGHTQGCKPRLSHQIFRCLICIFSVRSPNILLLREKAVNLSVLSWRSFY